LNLEQYFLLTGEEGETLRREFLTLEEEAVEEAGRSFFFATGLLMKGPQFRLTGELGGQELTGGRMGFREGVAVT
jgi:hypothetical protein